ncbi:hypothetical protein GALMADRAFT_142561 [Galerina marginata CBS 339.88]|uniref:Uncharacterized protein n=1 Tax=Galerina marginata (strain CBS 339.88) TaxID=685588 RepID=A0A067SPJ8_GALM3|nr:hypothetical protein GALMADRAFT_142561 [Galerina marginata CBS 339.88]
MEHSPGSLFKPIQPHQPVATLLLIENSQAMSFIWPDLRDKYLSRLIDGLVHANPSVPITVSVLESYPCQNHGPNSLPRQYSGHHDGLRDVDFNFNPANKITTGRINTCIDFLDAAKFQGDPPAQHLIIVAATTPSDDESDMGFTGNGYSPWTYLAQKMGSKNIHCHIVVSPQHTMGSLTSLFEETLRLQGNIEESLYPPADPTKVLVRLSARPSYEPHSDIRPAPGSRIGAPRRNSYPLDIFQPETFDETTGAPVSGEGDQAPSLVSQLQQVHGLTKKKVYGAKPVRQPFFREERVRDKYRQAPTPLTMSIPVIEQVPSAGGGRALSQSRADRMSRVGQSSPTDLQARRQHGWVQRRGSRLSTPESDGLPWPSSPSAHHDISPGSSYMSSDLSSPVTPITTMEDVYGNTTCIPPMSAPSVHTLPPGISAYQNRGAPEGQWPASQVPQYPNAYTTGVQTYFSPAATSAHQFYNENGQVSGNFDLQQPSLPPPPQQPILSPSYTTPPSYAPPPSAPLMQSPPAVPSQAPRVFMSPLDVPPPIAGVNAGLVQPAPSHSSHPAPNVRANKKQASEEDEERFSFSENFVAATAVLFESEVLPAYPNYPGMSSGLYTGGVQQTLPASQAGELYASRNKQTSQPGGMGPPPHQRPSGHHASSANMVANSTAAVYSYGVPAHPQTYGSSLTGWAG